MAYYIVILGPPGAGKGTQAKLISKKVNLVHVSSGDLFRENLKMQTELGKLALSFMNRGELVPDDVTISMVKERISRADCKNGALLDGFPRTTTQAEALSRMLTTMNGTVNCVPYIAVPAEELIKRLSGRWTCPTCGEVYHVINNPPKKTGQCDIDNGVLIQREDDKSATVERRIQVYFEQTAPLIEFYKQAGLLRLVDGTQSIDGVSQQMMTVVEKEL